MKSLFAETKRYFDKLFQDEWCDTTIHFGGEEFNNSDLEKWINIFYQPSYGNHTDLCSTTANFGNLHIACWGKVDLDAMTISDEIVNFINTNIDKNLYRVRGFEVSDHGYNESNMAYVVITFTVEALAR